MMGVHDALWGWLVEPTGVDLTTSIASAAVQVLMAAATGAATDVGQAVGDLVRTRLTGSDHARALEAATTTPQDPVAVDELQLVLRKVLSEDSRFMTTLVGVLTSASHSAPQHTITDAIVIGQSTMRGNNLALGNQSISNRRTSHGWLTAVAVLLAAVLIGVAIYTGVSLDDGNDPSPKPELLPEVDLPQPTMQPAVVDGGDLAAAILPDLTHFMPDFRHDDYEFPDESLCWPGCKNRFYTFVGYYRNQWQDARMIVLTYRSAEAATKAFTALSGELKTEGDPHMANFENVRHEREPIQIQDLGADGYQAVHYTKYSLDSSDIDYGAAMVIRTATVTIRINVSQSHYKEDSSAPDETLLMLEAIAPAVTARAWQAQYGEMPNAMPTRFR